APTGVGEGDGQGRLGHAEGREHRPGVEAVGGTGGHEVARRLGVDGLGAVEGDPPAGQVERAGSEAAQGPGGQGVGGGGAGGGGGPVVRHPLHPPGGGGEKILRGGQGQVGAGGHGQRQQPDETHVV